MKNFKAEERMKIMSTCFNCGENSFIFFYLELSDPIGMELDDEVTELIFSLHFVRCYDAKRFG